MGVLNFTLPLALHLDRASEGRFDDKTAYDLLVLADSHALICDCVGLCKCPNYAGV